MYVYGALLLAWRQPRFVWKEDGEGEGAEK